MLIVHLTIQATQVSQLRLQQPQVVYLIRIVCILMHKVTKSQ